MKTKLTLMDNTKFKPDEENQEQYIYRICSMKDSSGMTWKEIADIINEALGNNYTESAYRKRYQMFQSGLKACEKEIFTDDEYLKKIQAQTDEAYKAARRLSDQRREYHKLLVKDARSEHLEEELIKAANNLSKEKMLSDDDICYTYNIGATNDALLCVTDWHLGMVTDNIWNKYDIKECVNRVGKLYSKAREYLTLHKVNKLHIMVLGDLVNGAIHSTVRVASEEDTCDQLMHASELLAELINRLSKHVNEVHVYSTYGNHARTVQRKEDSIHSDNMERIIPWWLEWRLKENSKVHIEDNDYYEFIYLDILGHGIIGVHGDLESFRKLGIDMHTLFSKKYNFDVEYVFSGDKHHYETMDSYGIDNVLVSSLCGTDNYANNKRLYSKAGQTLCIFNKEDGKVCTYNITF